MNRIRTRCKSKLTEIESQNLSHRLGSPISSHFFLEGIYFYAIPFRIIKLEKKRKASHCIRDSDFSVPEKFLGHEGKKDKNKNSHRWIEFGIRAITITEKIESNKLGN